MIGAAPLLLAAFLVVFRAAGSAAFPPPCRQEICLTDYNKDYHRYNIQCTNLYVDLVQEGDVLGCNVSLDRDTGCISWKARTMRDCAVRETLLSGIKTTVPFTYNCTRDVTTLTAPTPIPSSPTPATPSISVPEADRTRHRTYTGAAFAVVLFLSPIALIFCLRSPQRFWWTRRTDAITNQADKDESRG